MSKQIISNISDLAAAWGTTPERIERDLYKYTECGAWISWTDTTITIGSIVEGSDAEFNRTFCIPAELGTIDEWIDELEALCDEAWHEANDAEEDHP